MPAPRLRINGFQQPWSRDQVALMSGEVCITATFLCGFYIDGKSDQEAGEAGMEQEPMLGAVPLITYAAILLTRILIYVDLGLHDPSVGGLDFPCIKGRKFEDRYCGQCKKMVPGLDHHCSWLNTCIGSSNYGRFLAVVTLGIIIHLVHLIYGVYMLFVSEEGSWAGWWGCLGLSAIFVPSVTTLFCFHVYLLWIGMGTYDWMLTRRAARWDYDKKAKNNKANDMQTSSQASSQARKNSTTAVAPAPP